MTSPVRIATVALIMSCLLHTRASAGNGDTGWMLNAKYGIFMHYQYRILLGYSYGTAALRTKPKLPPLSMMTAQGWNRFVDGSDGQGDANQFEDQELIDWIKTCHRQGGVCTLDWPFDPETGLLKSFGMAQLKRIAQALKGTP